MKDFNLKQWLFENKLGAYEKASRMNEFYSEDGYSDEVENRGDMNEIDPATLGIGQAVADAEMEKQDDLNSDMVDNVSMGVAAETVGYANIEKPADSGLATYLDKLQKHDFYYRMSSSSRTYDRGLDQENELKAIYSQLSDADKQSALDAYKEKAEVYYPANKYPLFADRLKTYTTDIFQGA